MQSIEDIIHPFLELIAPKTPFGSSLFIVLVAIVVTISTTLISRKLINVDKMKRYTKETKEFQSLRMKALRSQDRRLLKKIDDNKKRVDKMQKDLAMMRMKPMLFTFIPMILVFMSMNSYYGDGGDTIEAVVANIPFSLPENMLFQFGHDCSITRDTLEAEYGATVSDQDLNKWETLCTDNPNLHYVPTYIGWYIAVNITIGVIIQKFAGLTPE